MLSGIARLIRGVKIVWRKATCTHDHWNVVAEARLPSAFEQLSKMAADAKTSGQWAVEMDVVSLPLSFYNSTHIAVFRCPDCKSDRQYVTCSAA